VEISSYAIRLASLNDAKRALMGKERQSSDTFADSCSHKVREESASPGLAIGVIARKVLKCPRCESRSHAERKCKTNLGLIRRCPFGSLTREISISRVNIYEKWERSAIREKERGKGGKNNNACSDCRMNCNGGSARRFDLKLLIAPIIRFAATRCSNGHSFTIVQRVLSRAACISFYPGSNDIALLPYVFPLSPLLKKYLKYNDRRFCERPIYESPTLRFLPAARFNSKSSTRRQ